MKTTSLIIGILMLGFGASAQQEYSFSHYAFSNSFLNPGATGTAGTQNITGLFRKQWAGFNGSPMTGGISYDHPLDKYKMGLGGFVFSDKIGETTMTNVVANYSYHLKLDDKHKLGMGIAAGADFISTDFDRLIYWDQNDQVFSGKQNVVVPRVGVGFHFFADKYYVGISVPRILTFNDDNNVSINKENLPSLVSHYYLTGGYNFDLGEQFELKTSTLAKYTPNVIMQGDINATCIYNKMIGLGVGYKSLGFVTFNLLYTYDEVVSIGYAFDMTTTKMRNYSKGSHEVMITYNLPTKSKGSRVSY